MFQKIHRRPCNIDHNNTLSNCKFSFSCLSGLRRCLVCQIAPPCLPEVAHHSCTNMHQRPQELQPWHHNRRWYHHSGIGSAAQQMTTVMLLLVLAISWLHHCAANSTSEADVLPTKQSVNKSTTPQQVQYQMLQQLSLKTPPGKITCVRILVNDSISTNLLINPLHFHICIY